MLCTAVLLLTGMSEVPVTDKREALTLEIKDMIADATCHGPDDCAYIGFGARACGGYQDYLIYSKRTVDNELLQKKAKEHFELSKDYIQKQGLMGTCIALHSPVTTCHKGQCTWENPFPPLHEIPVGSPEQD